MRAFFGILGLAGAGFMISSVSSVGGCSSSNGGSTGTAGSTSTGTAGTSGQGTAGTTGNGGNNSGGSGGGGGASQPPAGCAVSDLPPPPAPLIADFAAVDGGASIPIGGTFTYASPATAVKPTATVTNGGWHVTLNAPGMTDPQYIGVGIYFNGNADGTDCVEGTQYTGIKFDITGTIAGTGCTAQFSINDSEHSDAIANSTDKKAGGPSGAYAPQTTLTVPTSPTVMVPFTGPTGGSPATAVDKSKLTGVQWQFTVTGGTTNACMVDIVIDNVSFY